jgi:monoamine oxidase
VPSRRQFLTRIGKAGGAGAMYAVMQAMGLLPGPEAGAAMPKLAADAGKGVRVIVLGGGVSGLGAALELQRGGYEVLLLEAAGRLGGRNWTLRGGDEVVEKDGTRQRCEFEPGEYFNAGPGRLPATHRRVMAYCRELGIELETQVTLNRSGRFHSDSAFNGQAVECRQLYHDTRGHLSELLSKCMRRGALDAEMDAQDREVLLDLLRDFGDLSDDWVYAGSQRAGYAAQPTAGLDFGRIREPLSLQGLIEARFFGWMMHEDEVFGHQATLLQPVGGMDRVPQALAEACRPGSLRTGCVVTELRNTRRGVFVGWRDSGDGTLHGETVDYCISTLPFPAYRSIRHNFSAAKRAALASGDRYDACVKMAWHSRRWWEQDLAIYGGVSYTTREIEQIWYPSSGFHRADGIIVTSYNDREAAAAFGKLPPAERAARARASLDAVHPGYGKELQRPISVPWQNIPYVEGPWPDWEADDDETATQRFGLLAKPEQRIFFAGDIASLWAGWQEGALAAAEQAIAGIVSHQAEAGRSRA